MKKLKLHFITKNVIHKEYFLIRIDSDYNKSITIECFLNDLGKSSLSNLKAYLNGSALKLVGSEQYSIEEKKIDEKKILYIWGSLMHDDIYDECYIETEDFKKIFDIYIKEKEEFEKNKEVYKEKLSKRDKKTNIYEIEVQNNFYDGFRYGDHIGTLEKL